MTRWMIGIGGTAALGLTIVAFTAYREVGAQLLIAGFALCGFAP